MATDLTHAPEELRTARLLFRKPRSEDAPVMFKEYAQDPAVTRYMTWLPHADVSESYAALERFISGWDTQTAFFWFLFIESGEMIGSIAARVDDGGFNLGYLLAHRYWGRGYMPEAINAVVEWAFTNSSVRRVWAACDIDNRASARALEKAGFTRERVLERFSIHPNISATARDCYCYARTRAG